MQDDLEIMTEGIDGGREDTEVGWDAGNGSQGNPVSSQPILDPGLEESGHARLRSISSLTDDTGGLSRIQLKLCRTQGWKG